MDVPSSDMYVMCESMITSKDYLLGIFPGCPDLREGSQGAGDTLTTERPLSTPSPLNLCYSKVRRRVIDKV